MRPLHHARRSRRLSRKSPVEVADYDWQLEGGASLQLLHSGSDVAIAPHATYPLPPSPSSSNTTTSVSPPSIVTHLPFTPGSSHTRNRKEGHIPRPPNAFMVFRSYIWNNDNLKNIERDNRNISRIAGRLWNQLPETDRIHFRNLAEEAKARHAQLYPEYRYSPGSQKKAKVTQRRTQRCVEVDNAKCDKALDLLLGGVPKLDSTELLGEAHTKAEPDQGSLALNTEGTSSECTTVTRRNRLKRPAAPCGESLPRARSKKQKTLPLPPSIPTGPLIPTPPSIFTPPSQSPFSLPVTEEKSEPEQTPGPFAHIPELVYPTDFVAEFVPTDDIPYLSLDGYHGSITKTNDEGTNTLFPLHMAPGIDTIFAGVKPEATLFVDSCMLGSYTANPPILGNPIPRTNFDIASYASLDTELDLVPLGSPVFTNPFEPSVPSAEHAALLGTLDQLFGQPISPLTQMPSLENW